MTETPETPEEPGSDELLGEDDLKQAEDKLAESLAEEAEEEKAEEQATATAEPLDDAGQP